MRPQHWLYTIPLRLRSLFRSRRVEQELNEELQFHLERKIEEGIAQGLSPDEARYAAMRAMDGLEQRKEEMRDMRRVRGDHDRAGDRDDRGALQHARCADLQAVPRSASARRAHQADHVNGFDSF